MRESLKARLLAKLRSGRGASITFALLLFLVCAVIGSVVLAAGTAASGRVSQLAEADRRYFAVTSAARLFREELNGQSYTIVREMSTTDTYNRTYGDPYEDTLRSGGTPEYKLYVQPSGLVRGSSLLGDAAFDLVLGQTVVADTNSSASVYEHTPIFETTPEEREDEWAWSKDLTVTVGTEEDGLPVVLVEVTMNEQGTMGFTFRSKEEDGEGAFVLSFTLTLNNPKTEPYVGDIVETEDHIEYKDGKKDHSIVEKTQVCSKTNELMWTASEIRNGEAKIGS